MGIRVAVCDEREELIPTGEAAQAGLDVMRGVDKPAAVQMLLRAMAPQAILCDEIGRRAGRAGASEDAARCGRRPAGQRARRNVFDGRVAPAGSEGGCMTAGDV